MDCMICHKEMIDFSIGLVDDDSQDTFIWSCTNNHFHILASDEKVVYLLDTNKGRHRIEFVRDEMPGKLELLASSILYSKERIKWVLSSLKRRLNGRD